MALKNNGYENSGNLIGVKLSQKDENDKKVDPHFVITRKVDDSWVQDAETYKSISGDITRIDISEYEWEGTPQKSIKIILRDSEANEAYILTVKLTILARDIINKLLTLQSLNGVEISVYTNKKGYASSTVRQNGEMTKWKFEFADLPKPLEITHPKTGAVISRDYSEIDELFLSEIQSFAEKFEIFGKSKKAAETPKEKTESKKSEDDTEWGDDVL
jgi:hypothetical protein